MYAIGAGLMAYSILLMNYYPLQIFIWASEALFGLITIFWALFNMCCCRGRGKEANQRGMQVWNLILVIQFFSVTYLQWGYNKHINDLKCTAAKVTAKALGEASPIC